MPESPVRMPNKVIGRPKKSSAEMRDSGARTGRIKAREPEERLEAGLPVEEKAVEVKPPAPARALATHTENSAARTSHPLPLSLSSVRGTAGTVAA
jgi:hypothetical protein